MHAFAVLSALLLLAPAALASLALPLTAPGDLLTCARVAHQPSCSRASTAAKANTYAACCTNTWINPANETDAGLQSGLLLVTQFWNGGAQSGETQIPDTTTVHGLWPDFCNGKYPASCTNITGIPEFSADELRAIIRDNDPPLYKSMLKFYLAVNATDPSRFWEHEYSKHATCFSTLRSQCILPHPGLSREETVVLEYFREIMKQFFRHPTYKWLAQAGITPSNTTTYALADVQAALRDASAQGKDSGIPFVGCRKGTNIVNEFWYYNHVRGSVLGGKYLPVNTTYASTCPAQVAYLPKY